ncbi:MAG: 30S ribosomal protein S17 [Pseudomonadota bacterium]
MSEQKIQRTLSGKVLSNKMKDTITVLVERRMQHPLYGKFIKKSSKIHAHAPDNDCNIGDVVKIKQIRPVSKTKAWQLVEVMTRSV